MNHNEILAFLKANLSQKRMHHSLMVAKQAEKLAAIYGEDIEKAKLAGLVHDVCKEMSKEDQLQWIKKSAIILDNVTAIQPALWHAIAGSVYILKEFSISDMQIINAVRYHTSARKNMTRFEQIIYLADLTSDDRNYPKVDELREIVCRSLTDGMREVLCFTMGDLIKEGQPISCDTYLAYNQYIME